MPRQKKSQSENLALSNYDSITLLSALNTFEGSLGWQVLKEFIYYQAAVHGTMANVLVQQTGKQFEACAAGAKAEVLREVIDQFMTQLASKIKGQDGVVEETRPE